MKTHWNPKVKFFNDIGFLYEGDDVQFVPHIGYVGLMPFALKLIPTDEIDKLWDILKALQSSQLLRAPGIGIRSLSRSDPLFGQGENYWRGAVWININYLCIEALKHYSEATKAKDASFSKLAANLAQELRRDIIRNIYQRYHEDGFLFESYDSITGKGRGTRPFTGWTALVVLMIRDELGASSSYL
jgi:mannosyl-oligosaccharide glucosidase